MRSEPASEWRPEGVRGAYDAVAESYATDFFDELDRYEFDRERLDEFAAACNGVALDVGCGPGHVTWYLAERGVDIAGVDLSPGMIDIARRRSPHLHFGVGDMRALAVPDGSLSGIVARYSIIHLRREWVPAVVREFRRALVTDGALLLAVHIGTGEIHTDEFRGQRVSVDATLFSREELVRYVEDARFEVAIVRQRPPEPDEYQAEKLYVLATAGG